MPHHRQDPDHLDVAPTFLNEGGGAVLGGGFSTIVGGALIFSNPAGWVAGATGALMLATGLVSTSVGTAQLVNRSSLTPEQHASLNRATGTVLGFGSVYSTAAVVPWALTGGGERRLEYFQLGGNATEMGVGLVNRYGPAVANYLRMIEAEERALPVVTREMAHGAPLERQALAVEQRGATRSIDDWDDLPYEGAGTIVSPQEVAGVIRLGQPHLITEGGQNIERWIVTGHGEQLPGTFRLSRRFRLIVMGNNAGYLMPDYPAGQLIEHTGIYTNYRYGGYGWKRNDLVPHEVVEPGGAAPRLLLLPNHMGARIGAPHAMSTFVNQPALLEDILAHLESRLPPAGPDDPIIEVVWNACRQVWIRF